MIQKLILILIALSSSLIFANDFKVTEEKVNFYKNTFKVECLDDKITDNFGNGFDSLYGTRNMKPVLHGIAYRGGANNYYHKSNKRDNHNPLPEDGLTNLSKYGFSEAVYLYTKNFESSRKVYEIDSNHLIYTQNSLNGNSEIKELLLKVNSLIDNPTEGPIYLHCWNGWHQSGFAAATILMQFCDYTNDKALEYWIDNTDGVSKGYDNVKNAIKEFAPFEDIIIDEKTKEMICPCYSKR